MKKSTYDDANRAYQEGNYHLALDGFVELIKAGDLSVALNAGWIHQNGLTGTINVSEAERLYLLAFDYDETNARYYLWTLLKNSPQRESDALVFLESAAMRGHPSAAYWAYIHFSDLSTDNSQIKATEYLTLASNAGHLYARRDFFRRKMSTEKHLFKKIQSTCNYFLTKLEGVILVLKNSDDLKIR